MTLEPGTPFAGWVSFSRHGPPASQIIDGLVYLSNDRLADSGFCDNPVSNLFCDKRCRKIRQAPHLPIPLQFGP
jgi:hypothetical protein